MTAPRPEYILIVDLPDKLNPGRVRLQPENAICWRLKRCDSCEGYSAKALVATCGHTFCAWCATKPPSAEASPRLWCHFCRRKQDSDPHTVEDTLLERMIFKCQCGFKGDLTKIKEHISSEPPEAEHKQIAEKSQNAYSPGVDGKQDVSSLNALAERAGSLFGQLHDARLGVTGLVELAGDHGYGNFWIPVQKLIDEYHRRRRKAFSPLYKWEGDGHSLATQFIIKETNEQVALGAVHRAIVHNASDKFQTFKILIGINIRDRKGVSVKKAITPSWQNGKPSAEDFERAAPDYKEGGFGPSSLISVDDLTKPDANILVNGCVNIQLELVPFPSSLI